MHRFASFLSASALVVIAFGADGTAALAERAASLDWNKYASLRFSERGPGLRVRAVLNNEETQHVPWHFALAYRYSDPTHHSVLAILGLTPHSADEG
ncbi:hypothetical protein FE840_011170 [Peteryoungia desertarenae]|uniref:Uncharacterized protein n=1 Tax=Peteryoungia desertarenae TaxID=1813451 RepID=A0ABX6QN90_9HYPH|nr:hypothetical protein [Peteryoungia desertarenae]QLF70054.1 hypothetical protein FE840_011170 [Peteryoungia desertarenae]